MMAGGWVAPVEVGFCHAYDVRINGFQSDGVFKHGKVVVGIWYPVDILEVDSCGIGAFHLYRVAPCGGS
jgi:hypothetical protein